jgi:hypothetical protein
VQVAYQVTPLHEGTGKSQNYYVQQNKGQENQRVLLFFFKGCNSPVSLRNGGMASRETSEDRMFSAKKNTVYRKKFRQCKQYPREENGQM